MSNKGLIIEERCRDIGDFLVGRLISFRKKRMVGPFIFIDHMGSTQLGPEHYMDVDQHPYIGLLTLTYLLEGEIVHKDSIGTHQKITPGSVNWMVAGKGCAHTERTPLGLKNGKTFTMHGFKSRWHYQKSSKISNRNFIISNQLNFPSGKTRGPYLH